jgi:hypothetical protein
MKTNEPDPKPTMIVANDCKDLKGRLKRLGGSHGEWQPAGGKTCMSLLRPG